MLKANEALSRANIDAQFDDPRWAVLDTNAVRCRSVLGIFAQQTEALRREEAVVQSILAGTFNSDQLTEGANEEFAFA